MKLIKDFNIDGIIIRNKLVNMYDLLYDLGTTIPEVLMTMGDNLYRIYYSIGDKL